MGSIEKGTILTLEGQKDRNNNYTLARVQNLTAEGTQTIPITIPWYLRGAMGGLTKGTQVVYCVFDDASGMILSRADGDWNGKIEEKNLMIDAQDNTIIINGYIKDKS